MEAKHAFLERLGLDQQADARAIRRAYARELKLIDQESDVDGFQRLRGSDEAALAWAAWRKRQRGEADGEAVAEAPPAGARESAPPAAAQACAPEPPAEPSPRELGRLVFEAFCAGMPDLMAPAGPGASQPQPEPRWTDALRGVLADERLFNPDARFAFEMHLAYLLANGWRPGHELLASRPRTAVAGGGPAVRTRRRAPPARLQEIAERIDYAPGPGVQPGELKVRFQVMLDAEGAVAALAQSSWSADPAFDRAVGKAIRESKPFLPHVVKNFPVEYSVRIGLRRKRPLRQRSAG